MGCRYKAAVDKVLWGIYTEGLVAELDSICADGCEDDICTSIKIPIFSITT
jgi:hypothetical protein